MHVIKPTECAPSVPLSAIMVRLPDLMHCPVCRVSIGEPCREPDGSARLPHMVAVIDDADDRARRKTRRGG